MMIQDTKNLPEGFALHHDIWATHPITYQLFKGDTLVAKIREACGNDPEKVVSISPDHSDVIADIWAKKKSGDRRDRDIASAAFYRRIDQEKEREAAAAAMALDESTV